MSLGYSGVRRRTMTQTVRGDDICPVRADREKKIRTRNGLLKALHAHKEDDVRTEWSDGRRDLWAESKVNNYNIMSHFFGAWLKEDHLSHLIGNFLCLRRIISHAVAFDGVVCRNEREKEREGKLQIETWLENFHNSVLWETFCSNETSACLCEMQQQIQTVISQFLSFSSVLSSPTFLICHAFCRLVCVKLLVRFGAVISSCSSPLSLRLSITLRRDVTILVWIIRISVFSRWQKAPD